MREIDPAGVADIQLLAEAPAIAGWIGDRFGSPELVYARGGASALAFWRDRRQGVKGAAEVCRKLQAQGLIALVQRRRGPNDFEYVAQRAAAATGRMGWSAAQTRDARLAAMRLTEGGR